MKGPVGLFSSETAADHWLISCESLPSECSIPNSSKIHHRSGSTIRMEIQCLCRGSKPASINTREPRCHCELPYYLIKLGSSLGAKVAPSNESKPNCIRMEK